MKMSLRFAELKDMHEIAAIYSPYVLSTANSFEYEAPDDKDMALRFVKIERHFPWIVYESTDGIIGYAYADEAFERKACQWDAEISVYISGKYHRRGLATSLYKCIEDILKVQGYRNIYAKISASNEGSIKFHENLGYCRGGVYINAGYKLGEWHDLAIMCKSINALNAPDSPPISYKTIEKEVLKEVFLKYAVNTK